MYKFLRSVSVGRCVLIFLLLWGCATFLVFTNLDQNIATHHFGPRLMHHGDSEIKTKDIVDSIWKKLQWPLKEIKRQMTPLGLDAHAVEKIINENVQERNDLRQMAELLKNRDVERERSVNMGPNFKADDVDSEIEEDSNDEIPNVQEQDSENR